MTAQNIIEDAMTAMQEISRGQTLAPEDLTQGLAQLNALLDSWSTNRLNLFTVKRVQYQLVPLQQDYTIGPTGADFTDDRPVLIQTATIVLAA